MRGRGGRHWGRLGKSGLTLSEGEREGRGLGGSVLAFSAVLRAQTVAASPPAKCAQLGLVSPGHRLGAACGKRASVQRRPWVSQPSSRGP